MVHPHTVHLPLGALLSPCAVCVWRRFDLDDQFASEKVRLAHLTNKCNDDDLEYFIKEAGDLLGVSQQLPPEVRDARYVLCHVMKQIVAWKKLNSEPAALANFKALNRMP